jgi:type IV pilus assembly protein PilA
MFKINKKAFTLIELLIVIAIISIIASVVFVALDPLTRFRDSRDAKRWADINALLSAIKIDQVDNGGSYMSTITAMTTGQVYMITDGVVSTGCDAGNAVCGTDVTATANCVNVAELVQQGYLGSVPLSPKGARQWTSSLSGYTMERGANGIITIRACEAENTTEIKSAR